MDEHARPPQHGDDRDIFERLYAVRLDRLRALEECRMVLAPFGRQGLLGGVGAEIEDERDEADDDALMSELAELEDETQSLTQLRHVRSSAEKRAAEEVATRQRCADVERLIGRLFRRAERRSAARLQEDARAAILHLVGALMLETNDEWTVARRYMGLESLARITDTPHHRLPAVAA